MAHSLARDILAGVKSPSAGSYHVLVEGSGFELTLGGHGCMRHFSVWRRVRASSEGEARIVARAQVVREWAACGWDRQAGLPVLATPIVSRLSRISRWAARDTPFEFAPAR